MRLEVTRRSGLAVDVLRLLIDETDRLKGQDLAERVGSTPGFLSQVITPLVRAGWMTSDPGPAGGYALVADPSLISLLDVIEAVEGPTDTGRCVLFNKACEEAEPCALHWSWVDARQLLLERLAATSVSAAPGAESA